MKKVYELEYRTKIRVVADSEEEAINLSDEIIDTNDYELEFWGIEKQDDFDNDMYDF